jgi:hypothetical protein
MAHNPLEPSNKGNSMPGMTPALMEEGIDPSEFVYRVGKFNIGGEDDDTLQLESLLTRSLNGDVIVVERKDAISSATLIYTCVILYMEKRLNA